MVNEQIIYPITNEEYQFSPRDFNPINGYLIVGVKDKKAVINHFGENVKSHEKAISWYQDQDIEVRRVYTGGHIIKISQLKDKHNQKPIDKVVGALEKILLKK
jgi:hypothetical protein